MEDRDFYSRSPEKVKTVLSESKLHSFLPHFHHASFLPSFFPQTETQMKWKKISTEIRVKMKYNHSFVLMTNIQRAPSLFQKLARNWKSPSLLSN